MSVGEEILRKILPFIYDKVSHVRVHSILFEPCEHFVPSVLEPY